MLQLFLFRAMGSFFMLGIEQKCQPQRLTDDEKHPKAVHEKWKFGPKYKWSKNLIFGILFLKVLFRAYKAFIFVQTFQWISSEFFLISDFLAESRKANKKKTCKKDHTFYNTVLLKKLTHFTNINSLDIENNMLQQHNQKLSDFTNFQKTSLLHNFLTPKNYIPEAHWKQMPVYFFISP